MPNMNLIRKIFDITLEIIGGVSTIVMGIIFLPIFSIFALPILFFGVIIIAIFLVIGLKIFVTLIPFAIIYLLLKNLIETYNRR